MSTKEVCGFRMQTGEPCARMKGHTTGHLSAAAVKLKQEHHRIREQLKAQRVREEKSRLKATPEYQNAVRERRNEMQRIRRSTHSSEKRAEYAVTDKLWRETNTDKLKAQQEARAEKEREARPRRRLAKLTDGSVQPSPGHLYFAAVKDVSLRVNVKIGRTTNLTTRLQMLNTGSPFRLFYLATVEVPDAVLAEQLLHKAFSKYRLHGEWFKLEPVEAFLKSELIAWKDELGELLATADAHTFQTLSVKE